MFEKFTEGTIKIIMLSQIEARRMGHNFVGTEHLLLGALGQSYGIAAKALNKVKVPIRRTRKEIELYMGRERCYVPDDIAFTPRAKRVLETAIIESSNLGHCYVGTEHLLLALIGDSEGVAVRTLLKLNIDLNKLKSFIFSYMIEAAEEGPSILLDGEETLYQYALERGKTTSGRKSMLERYGENMSEEAASGILDPIIGRKKEIDDLVAVLARRTKNNPVLMGNPGVGKTAVAEGLAQLITSGQSPEFLQGGILVALDIGSILAGTKYRGEFEERIKLIVEEAQRNSSVIIVIDEIHTIIGAGAAEGSVDAANILKPALARGKFRCIGATTTEEYKKYIERDAALERRFQPVRVKEPTIGTTIDILRGLRSKFESHHVLTYNDKAVEQAAILSEKYVADRFLPDKAIDVLDESGARVRLQNRKMSPQLKAVMKELQATLRDKEESIKENDFAAAQELLEHEIEVRSQLKVLTLSLARTVKLKGIDDEVWPVNPAKTKSINGEVWPLDPPQRKTIDDEVWLFDRVKRESIDNHFANEKGWLFDPAKRESIDDDPDDHDFPILLESSLSGPPIEGEEWRLLLQHVLHNREIIRPAKETEEIKQIEEIKEIKEIEEIEETEETEETEEVIIRKIMMEQGIERVEIFDEDPSRSETLAEDSSVSDIVKENDVADVIANWTGIPLAKLTSSESKRLLKIEDSLHERIIGQKHAVISVSKAIRRSRVGLQDPNRPIASFIFAGPTGVGKTELTKALAEYMFDKEDSMIRLDMSEYMEKHTISKLIGSPPGYIGYDEGGQLTEAVRQKPYSVILFDEVEKAHPDIFNLLLQILDDGRLTDSTGRVIDFTNTLIVMTTNLGSKIIETESGIKSKSDGKKQPLKLMIKPVTGWKPTPEPEIEAEVSEQVNRLVNDELKLFFRPEFLNRIDGIIVFHHLTKMDIWKICTLMLGALRKRLKKKEIKLVVDDSAQALLTEEGYDPIYGARPLRRAIMNYLEDSLAELCLSKPLYPDLKILVCRKKSEGKLAYYSNELDIIFDYSEVDQKLLASKNTNFDNKIKNDFIKSETVDNDFFDFFPSADKEENEDEESNKTSEVKNPELVYS